MRRLFECSIHSQFMFDIERLEEQIDTRIICCPRCYIERVNKLVAPDPPKPKFVCWYPQGEQL